MSNSSPPHVSTPSSFPAWSTKTRTDGWILKIAGRGNKCSKSFSSWASCAILFAKGGAACFLHVVNQAKTTGARCVGESKPGVQRQHKVPRIGNRPKIVVHTDSTRVTFVSWNRNNCGLWQINPIHGAWYVHLISHISFFFFLTWCIGQKQSARMAQDFLLHLDHDGAAIQVSCREK